MEKQTESKDNIDEIAVGLWENLSSLLREKLGLPCTSTWFGQVRALGYSENDGLQLGVPSEWKKTWISKNYLTIIEEMLSEITAKSGRVFLTVDKSLEEINTPGLPAADENEPPVASSQPLETQSAEAPANADAPTTRHNFLPQFTFDTFVEADCNRLAYNACRRVAEQPDASFNPLIIYGGAGLGKTHLLRAIENQIIAEHHNLRVVFVSSERFMNELVHHLQKKTPSAFRDRFRSADVLLIDDINKWNMAKEYTQDEFLNTFNDLYLGKKQIVVSSNIHPQQSELTAPIKSRLDGGLVLRVSSPTVETCAAILSKKAEKEKLKIPSDIIYSVANRYHSSIRLLEGALKKIAFYIETYKCDTITADIVNNALADLPSPTEQRPPLEKILQTVSLHFDVRFSDLIAASRKKSIAYPRHLAMYLCRKYTAHSLPEIGERFGGRDHTTVIHAIKKITKELDDPDASTARDVLAIENILSASPLLAVN